MLHFSEDFQNKSQYVVGRREVCSGLTVHRTKSPCACCSSAASLLLVRPQCERHERNREKCATQQPKLLCVVFGAAENDSKSGCLKAVRVNARSSINSNSLESDLQASYNLRGGLTTVVRTGIINIPAKAFHLFHPLRRLSPIRLHGECDSLRCGWTASYYDNRYGL